MSSDNENPDWFNRTPTMNFSDPTNKHDRILVVEGEKFHVNSDILSIHSEFFDTMFNSDFKEKNENEIEIKEVTAEAFRNFLLSIYPARMTITKENYQIIIDVAVRFMAAGVFDNCRVFIMEQFDNLDKFDVLEMAVKNNLIDVKNKLRAFFRAHQRKIGDIIICKDNHITNGKCGACTNSKNWKVYGGNVLNEHSILKIHKERILTLSSEAKVFILESLVNKL